MGSVDNTEFSREDSGKWILENGEIDSAVDSPSKNDEPRNSPTFSNSATSIERQRSIMRKRNAAQGNNDPRMTRLESGVDRGLKSLRFLDRTVTGKEVDEWNAIERRFNQAAIEGRIFRDNFGDCIGSINSRVFFFVLFVFKVIFLGMRLNGKMITFCNFLF